MQSQRDLQGRARAGWGHSASGGQGLSAGHEGPRPIPMSPWTASMDTGH